MGTNEKQEINKVCHNKVLKMNQQAYMPDYKLHRQVVVRFNELKFESKLLTLLYLMPNILHFRGTSICTSSKRSKN